MAKITFISEWRRLKPVLVFGVSSFALATTFVLPTTFLLPTTAHAHSARAVMDAAGNSATFTGMARITCFNDGNGNAAYLAARVRDNSPPGNNLYINVQLIKGTQAISITDRVPGDANYSDSITLNGGNGVYTVLLNKTGPGARSFDLEWHCMSINHDHTGTEILVDQFQ